MYDERELYKSKDKHKITGNNAFTKVVRATERTIIGAVWTKRPPTTDAAAVKLSTGTSANGSWMDWSMFSHSADLKTKTCALHVR